MSQSDNECANEDVQVVLGPGFDPMVPLLREAGIRIAVFSNMESLIKALPEFTRAKLYLLPIFMPRIRGSFDIVPEIRKIHPKAKTWVATASRLSEIDSQWIKMGLCDRFISWQPSVDEIREQIGR